VVGAVLVVDGAGAVDGTVESAAGGVVDGSMDGSVLDGDGSVSGDVGARSVVSLAVPVVPGSSDEQAPTTNAVESASEISSRLIASNLLCGSIC